MGFVISGKPDLVDPVVESDNTVVRHDLTDIVDKPLWVDRKATISDSFEHVLLGCLLDLFEITEIPMALGGDFVVQLIDRICDITDHANLGIIDRINRCGQVVDVNDLEPSLLHEKW